MSDISTPPPTPEPTPAPARPNDNFLVKWLGTFVAWAAPLPVCVTLLKLIQDGDPFMALKQALTAPSGVTAALIMLASFLPSALILMILHRGLAPRLFALLMLLAIGCTETFFVLNLLASP